MKHPPVLLGLALLLLPSTAPAIAPQGDADPVVTVTIRCNGNGTLTVNATATDADNDLNSLRVTVQRYGTENDCINNTGQEDNTTVANISKITPVGMIETGDVTRKCETGKWYSVVATAKDAAGNSTLAEDGCCQCLGSNQVSVRSSSQVDTNSLGTGLGPAVASHGDLIAVYYNDGGTGGSNTVNVVTADGRGLSWSAPVQVDEDPGPVPARKFTQFDGIAVLGQSIYVAWEDERNGASNEDLFFNCSTDGGVTWVGEQLIDKGTAAGVGAVRDWRMVVVPGAPAHRIYFLISTDPTTTANEELYLTASLNGGVTFGSAVPVSSLGPGVEDVDGIALVAEGLDVHVAWQGDRSGVSTDDILYQRSSDGGATWLVSDVQLDSSGPAFGDAEGDMTISKRGDTIAVAWQEELTSPSNEEVRVNVSGDGGATWSGDVMVGGYDPLLHDVDAAEVKVAFHAIVVAWDDNRTGSDEVSVASSTDGGVTWSETQVSTTGGGFPAFAGVPVDFDGTEADFLAWSSGAFPNTTNGAFTTDGGVTWTGGVTLSDNVGFDVDFAEVGMNSLYRNGIYVWLSDDNGQNNVYVGGFRPQTLDASAKFLAGTPVHFDLSFFDPGSEPFVGVLASTALGSFLLPADGREIGLDGTDPIFNQSLGLIPGPLSAVVAPDGTASTSPLLFPPTTAIPSGTELHLVAVGFASLLDQGSVTDIVTMTVQ